MKKFFYWTGYEYEYSAVEGTTLPLSFLRGNIREIKLPDFFDRDDSITVVPMEIYLN